MPSPVAHAALVLLAPALTPAAARARVPMPRLLAFYALVTVALCIPDVDFALPLVMDVTMHQAHGAWLHSFVAAAVFAMLFAPVARWIVGGAWPLRSMTIVGFTAYASHIVMDAMTNGRGVMMFWPMSGERVRLPITVFTGIHWSDPSRWDLHARTAVNEGVFTLIVAAVAAMLTFRPRRAAEVPA